MQRRKSIILCALLITLLFTLPIGGVTLDHIRLKIDDEVAELKYPLILEKGQTLAALEDIARALNLKAVYEAGSKITLKDNGCSIELSLNDEDPEIRAKIIEDTVYVPLRVVAESFGARVTWLPEIRAILVTTGGATRLESSLDYTIVDRGELQSDGRLSTWFDRNHRNRGAYSITIDNDTYVLISAGPKPTGGFGLNLESAIVTNSKVLLITVKLLTPNPGDMVTMAFTYPNIILRFPNQTFEGVDMVLDEPGQDGDLLQPIQPRINIKE